MNIDISTLLLGGAQSKLKAGLLSDEDFGLALEGKLAQLFTGLDPQALMALPEVVLPTGMLPGQRLSRRDASSMRARSSWMNSLRGALAARWESVSLGGALRWAGAASGTRSTAVTRAGWGVRLRGSSAGRDSSVQLSSGMS